MKFLFLYFYFYCTVIFFVMSGTYNDECKQQKSFRKIDEEIIINNHITGCGRDKESILINPHKDFQIKRTKNDPVCLKCAMCLAVAREVILNLKPMINRLPLCNPKLLKEKIVYKIDNLCSTGFLGYGLKMYKCHEMIAENYGPLRDVSHELDGSWISKLRSECKTLTKNINISFFINQVSRKFEDIPEYFCYGNGIFSSCSELEFEILNICDADEFSVIPNSRSFFYAPNCQLK